MKAIFSLFVERDPWSVPHGSTKKWWEKLLEDFNTALNVLEVHPKFLLLMTANTAKVKVENELDAFETQDADAGQQTCFGDEEYGDWQQMVCTLAQLRNDAL